jgi:carbon-monoxide dehydrogenase medium subunit
MIPSPFEYHAPDTIDDALAILAKHGERAKVLGGGHSLIPALKLRLAVPEVVVDLRRIRELASIEAAGDRIRIGALVTHREVAEAPLLRDRAPLLAETARAIGDVQVRNLGTLVGSICHADPAADYPAALLALDAEVEVRGPRGERSVKVDELLQGLFTTGLEPGEIACSVMIPRSRPASAAYLKMRQSASGFALAGVAVQLRIEGGRAVEAAIGITGAAERAFRAHTAEDILRGGDLGDGRLEEAAAGIAGGRELLSDMHASAEYRAHLVEVLALRALRLARSRA